MRTLAEYWGSTASHAYLQFRRTNLVLEERFLVALKDPNGKLHQHVYAIVSDDSHTVETWTGKRYLAYV